MKYLLDTHIMLWWLVDPKKLSKKAHLIISDRQHTLYISSVSFWELAIKNSLGKITIPRNLIQLLTAEGFEFLPLYPSEALSIVDLPTIHNDPFDRMLISQAKFHDLVFITRDKILADYPVISLKG